MSTTLTSPATPQTPALAAMPDDEERDGYGMRKEIALARGRRSLTLLANTLKLAELMIDSYLQNHPQDCGCVYCGCRSGRDIKFDVEGMRWPIEMAVSVLDGVIPCSIVKLDADNFGDDLRKLADFSDAIDAADDEATEVAKPVHV